MVTQTIKPGYKQTEIGVIPEDWEVKTIVSEIDLLTGFPFSSNQYVTNGIKLLRCSNIKRGETDWSEEITQYWREVTPELRPYLLREGDIVIAMDGSLVGRSFARLSKQDIPALLLQRVARIRSREIDMGYLKEYVCSEYFTKYCDSVKTVTAIPHISPEDIRNFIIPIPPTKEEESAIAEALSNIDELVKQLDELIEKRKNIKQGAMQELLTGKRRLPDFGERWDVKQLGRIGTFSKGRGIKKLDVLSEGFPCVRYGEIYTHYNDYIRNFFSFISPETSKNSQRLHKGDLLFAGSGETAEDIGKCVAFLGDEEAYAGGDIIIFSQVGQNSMYLGYLMNHSSIEKQKAFMSQGEVIVHISAASLGQLQMKIPPPDEQVAIAQVLSDMDAEIEGLEKRRGKYLMIKKGMMQQLLTGSIRLR